jgi:lipopolysaccharide biosynthesis protein
MASTMKRLAIYAHYDAQGSVKRFTTQYLAELAKDCSRIDFVSTAALPESELAKVAPYCEHAVTKENRGFDFGMWKHVLDKINFEEWDEVLLTNSSVFGPLQPLGPIFDQMSADDCDFWGMNDSNEQEWHLQSYFLAFKRSVLTSDTFKRFWGNMTLYRNKGQIIRSYEIGLSVLLSEAGFRGRAYVPAASLFPKFPLDMFVRYKARNVLAYHALRILRRGLPFVKAELLRDNPARVNLRRVYRELRRSNYDLSLIEFDRPRTDYSRKKKFEDFIRGRGDHRQ